MAGRTLAAAGSTLVLALLATGCGAARQDVGEPHRIYRVSIPVAAFPAKQRLAQNTSLYIAVRNDDTQTIPNVAVTIDSFDYRTTQPNVASQMRPVWIVDQGPYGGTTAYVNTWALGRLPPGQTAIFRWQVTPVHAGVYHVAYHVAAGLNGDAVARLSTGGPPVGSFSVYIPSSPALSGIVPRTGTIVTTPKSVPQPVPQVKPNTSIPAGPNEPTSTTPAY